MKTILIWSSPPHLCYSMLRAVYGVIQASSFKVADNNAPVVSAPISGGLSFFFLLYRPVALTAWMAQGRAQCSRCPPLEVPV